MAVVDAATAPMAVATGVVPGSTTVARAATRAAARTKAAMPTAGTGAARARPAAALAPNAMGLRYVRHLIRQLA